MCSLHIGDRRILRPLWGVLRLNFDNRRLICFVFFCFILQTWRIFSCYFGAIFNWESKVSRGRFGFALLSSVIGLKARAFSQPIRFKNWSRSQIGHQCFPALSAVCSLDCEFSFGDEDINLRSYWWLGLLWFCFLWTQLKTALTKDIFVTLSTSRAGLV